MINAVTIQRQIGGTLAGLFDMVADTVRQRQQFGRKVKGLTAMGRMSAYVLVGLPIVMGALVTLVNGQYLAPLYQTGVGPEAAHFRSRDDDHRKPHPQKNRLLQG